MISDHDALPGIARVLLRTVGAERGWSILASQFGWDAAFAAVATADGKDAGEAMWHACTAVNHDTAR